MTTAGFPSACIHELTVLLLLYIFWDIVVTHRVPGRHRNRLSFDVFRTINILMPLCPYHGH